ncbi:TerB family tellurite resistance protein [Aureliella helgolandensis]|uniref:Tellurite resistance protein TerB n=1 Tax=Aureliella helgolandensis TaxID=2527968 RepID=A0A518GCC6_9BACT|nr:TerB family tellurite resistance protein [Aureliella helgolandensis]QDV26256.1 Tellurite resistance protein TerB [Aureliella helgolandensis]
MLVIGTFDWASTRLRGMFACPNCESTESFRLRASRPFLTLYFIPVLPIGGLHEYVECSNCKSSFEPVVLTNHMVPATGSGGSTMPQTNEAPFEIDLLTILALMMVEDGQVTEGEIRIARRLFENMTEENLTREDLGKACSQVQVKRLNTSNFLATAAPRRTHDEKLLMVQAMFGVAGADGEISPGRMSSMVRAQQLLGLDESEFQLAVQATSGWLT